MHLTEEMKEELKANLESWLQRHITDEKSKFDGEVYKRLYDQLLSESAHIDWNSWKFISADVQRDFNQLPPYNPEMNSVLDRVAVIKLNGGLGTTMGCTGPKSFIEVKDGYSFLELAIQQVEAFNERYGCKIPLILMDSFNTKEATREKIKGKGVRQFEQSRCPRIYSDSLKPVEEEKECWYPPGHGNIFQSLAFSGELDRLIEEGRDIAFVSNIDNTGAVVEPKIVQFFAEANAEYAMECTEKTYADIKGGTLIEIKGRIMHLEIPQVPPEHLDDFCSTRVFKVIVRKLRIFNTNNIWVNLRAVRERLDRIRSEIIVNKKRLSSGREVIQLETSIGGCIRAFDRTYCVHVPRSRFLPVKSTNDLLAISSNLYTLHDDYSLKLEKGLKHPFIHLSPQFTKVSDFHQRVPAYPDMKGLATLRVEGDVCFEEGVTLKGDVKIVAGEGRKVVVQKGTVIENSEFTG